MKRIGLLLCIGVILIAAQATQAQHFAVLSEEDCIELSLDMIRKGVQQEHVDRVMRVMGENVTINGVETKSDNEIAQDLNQVFANSSQRSAVEMPSSAARGGSPAFDSNLRDFDILSPSITIRGDSAFVDCELVLWYAVTDSLARTGSRTTEQLVFWSPAHGQWDKTTSRDPLRWRLVGCTNLFDFLSDYGAQSLADRNIKGGQK